MVIYTELAVEEVVSQVKSGRLGGVDFGPSARKDSGSLVGDWQHGVFLIDHLEEDDKEELPLSFGLPKNLSTKVWISTQPYYEGQIALYHVMAHLLHNWPGDLALLNYGETVMVQRVGGQIMMRVEQFNEDILPIFAGFDYQPLPAPK